MIELMSHHLSDCPLCGGHNFVPLLKARDFHYGNPGEYRLAQCSNCTLGFLDPMYDETELSKFYPADYYSFTDRFTSNQSSSGLRRLARKLFGTRERQTKDPHFDHPGKMLDVGCGSGWFLVKMRDQGWDVRGVEPSAAAAKLGQSERGLDIFPGTLLDIAFPAESFDYIRFNHSFEHVGRPNEVLAEVHRILKNDGKLLIAVPNRASVNASCLDLIGFTWRCLYMCSAIRQKHFLEC